MTVAYYVCGEVDPGTGQCTTWVAMPSMLPELPTIADAQVIGGAFLLGWVSVAALKYLLKPRKDHSDE